MWWSSNSDEASLPPLRYLLPETVFKIKATERKEVVPTSSGHVLRDVVDVAVVPVVAADHGARCLTTFSLKWLETLSLTVDLDDSGLIESVNTSSSRNLAPVVSLVGKIVGGALAFAVALAFRGSVDPPESNTLEREWEDGHPEAAVLLQRLRARGKRLSEQLGEEADPATTIQVGEAVRVVQRELAAVDQVRREWIAGRADASAPSTWRLRSDHVARVPGAELPRCTPDDLAIPAESRALADLGFLPVLLERTPNFDIHGVPAADYTRTDSLIFRRARPVTMGVYRRDPDGDRWVLDEELVADFDIVDRHSVFDTVVFDGAWSAKRTVAFGFHPDKSLKKYVVASESSVPGLAEAAGEVVTSVSKGLDDVLKSPTKEKRELEQAKSKLDLLKTADDYAQLSALHARSAELAELEQRAKFAEASEKLS